MKLAKALNPNPPNLLLCLALFWLISPQIFYGNLLQPISEPIWFDGDTIWRNKIVNSNPRKRNRVICYSKLQRLQRDGKSKTNQQGRYGFRRRLLLSWKAYVQRLRGTLGAHGANLKHEGKLEAKEKRAGERFYRSYFRLEDWSYGIRLHPGVLPLENYEIRKRRCSPSYYSPLHALLFKMMIIRLLDGYERGIWEKFTNIKNCFNISETSGTQSPWYYCSLKNDRNGAKTYKIFCCFGISFALTNHVTDLPPRKSLIEQFEHKLTTVEETESSDASMNNTDPEEQTELIPTLIEEITSRGGTLKQSIVSFPRTMKKGKGELKIDIGIYFDKPEESKNLDNRLMNILENELEKT